MNRKQPFATKEKFHIYNRGTEKRNIFLDKQDYERFLFIAHSFNDSDKGYNVTRDISKRYSSKRKPKKERNPLVMIEDYCLMPNHYHLILEQVEENGISKFLQKVMTGYTMYFNKKYNRTGALFQGKTKSRHIDTNPYYLQLKIYLNLNPVDLFDKGWKETGKVKSIKDSMKFLNEFPWCSCKSYKTYEKYLSGQSQLLYLDDLC